VGHQAVGSGLSPDFRNPSVTQCRTSHAPPPLINPMTIFRTCPTHWQIVVLLASPVNAQHKWVQSHQQVNAECGWDDRYHRSCGYDHHNRYMYIHSRVLSSLYILCQHTCFRHHRSCSQLSCNLHIITYTMYTINKTNKVWWRVVMQHKQLYKI